MAGDGELTGGTTPGVVRVGDTVRRPAGPWTPAVDALLRHLELHRFPAPRSLGLDGEGRQVVSWVAGTSTWPDHARHWGTLDQLRRGAQLVRRLHDVLDNFRPPPDMVWRGGWGRSTHGPEPICHNDLAPWNIVAGPDGALTVIDWDGAGPGDRMAELAYAMHGFVPLVRDAECARRGWPAPPARVQRVECFFSGYGLRREERPAVGAALVRCAEGAVAFGERMSADGREPWASWWARDGGAGDRANLALTMTVVQEWSMTRG